MTAKNDLIRMRNTSATRRRMDNIRKLIDELRTRDMTADDMCFLLKFSPSGARKYIRDLIGPGVIELAHHIEAKGAYIGKPVFRLSSDSERVEAFLLMIQQEEPRSSVAKTPLETRLQNTFGTDRHFHVMADDIMYKIRINRDKPRRDDLVTALFGDGPAKAIE